MKKILLATISALAVGAVLLASPTRAQADTIFSNFVSGNSFSGDGWCVSGASSPCGLIGIAAAFTPSADFTLSQIDIALEYISGTNEASVTLVNDASGLPGFTALEWWDLTGLPGYSTTYSPTSLLSSGGITLLSGTQYWVIAEPLSNDTYDLWSQNSQGGSGFAFYSGGSGWSYHQGTTPAFDVLGTPLTQIPEPGSLALVATGLVSLAGAGLFGRKRFLV